jgi:PAS domain S-box-containing protein
MWLAALPLACVPFAFAWAVMRYRLWDLGVMVRNGLSYTLTLIFGLTTFSLIDLAVRRSMPVGLGFTRDLLTFIGGILAVGLVVPTHRGIHGMLERLQYGGALRYRRGLQRVAQELLQERDLDRLCQALLAELEQALDLDRANLLLLQGPALVPVRPHAGLPRAVALAALRDGVWEGEFETLSPVGLPGESATAEQQLYVAGYRYVFPLLVRGQKIGLALSSLRHDRLPLSSEDIDIVRSLLDQAALAIENAQLLDQVHRQLARVTSLQRHNEEILESSPAGIVVLDADGSVASANLAFAAIAGRSRGELTGKRLLDLFPLEALPEPGSGIRQLSFEDASGAQRHLQLTAAPLAVDLAAPAGARADRVLVVQDVSERVAMERALREQDRLASLGVLAAGVAHEINNPIAVIRGYRGAMREEDHSAELKEELRILDEEATLCQRIAEELLMYARTPALSPIPVDMAELLRDVAERTESVPVRSSRSPGTSPIIVDAESAEMTVDPLRIRQVVVNLVTNAREAVTDGTPIIVLGRVYDDGYRIEVQDRGVGISAEALDHIFEPFFTTKRNGTGLGLAVCYGRTPRRRRLALRDRFANLDRCFDAMRMPYESDNFGR